MHMNNKFCYREFLLNSGNLKVLFSYTDGNPSLPGRVCAALLCGLCNGHGDCVHDPLTNNITCACVEGYSGQFCELAPSRASAILLIILALLFLLLTLCCCLYFCLKTR